MRTKFWLLIMLLLLLGGAGWWLFTTPSDMTAAINKDDSQAERSALQIETFTLSNGMEVILLPSDRVPAVSHMLWLRVGAADDPLGKSGLAHYHEHLMFKGTPNVAAGEYSKRLESLGGEFNAFTGSDFTGYYVNIAREHLETVMQLESDRMQHLTPAPADYAKELKVIIEERESRIGSKPDAQWREQMRASLFLHHPYRIPVIGWMHEIKALKPEDAKAFYQQYYHAGNMVLIVAGDVTREELEPMAERYYGQIPAGEAVSHDWVQEPPAAAARRIYFSHEEVTQPRFERHYQAPGYGTGSTTEQAMALSLLSEWLGGGQTSLLYETLVKEKQLAVSVRASYSALSRGPSSFTISAVPAAGVSLEALEAEIDAVIERAMQQEVDLSDLQRFKTLYKASAIYARDSLSAMAHYAGYLSMLGLPMQYLTEWEAHVMAVTPEQVQQAAQRVFRPQASVTGYLLPEAPDE